MFTVYILESQKNGRWYIGHTEHMQERLLLHNAGRVRSSAAHIPYVIVHQEMYEMRSTAIAREMQIKRSGIIRKAIKNRLQREKNTAPSSNG
ncbi:MAG: GIY-YIG nuclease family protein [Patescibacteria group bacterium]